MRLGINGEIILSKRNLLALLHKVDSATSERTLIAPGHAFVVMSEPDEAHYGDREPGRMSSETESYIADRSPAKKPILTHRGHGGRE